MKRLFGTIARTVLYTGIAVLVIAFLLAGAVRLGLPRLEAYKPEAERFLSDYLGQEIMMTSLSAEWDGLNLVFKAAGVRVAVGDHPGSGMRFGEIYFSFNPLGFIGGERTFDHLELTGPTIEVSRLADGRFRVGDTIIGQPRGVVRRLLQGRNLEITDGTLVWRDALAPGDAIEIRDVDMRIRPRGERRRFELTARPPDTLMGAVRVRGTYDPDSLRPGDWTAAVDLSVSHLNLTEIPDVFQERLPWQSHGYIDTQIHADWQQGRLTAASADITAHDFIIPYARDKKPLSARRFASSVSWRRSEDDWRLVFTEPEIVLDETPVSVSHFEVQRRESQRTYLARQVNVRDLLGVVDRLDIDLPWKALIDRLQPRGVFSEATLTLTGPYLEARDWRFEGDFRNVGWAAQARYPGIQGLNGRMSADDNGGELNIASSTLEVDAANWLRRPVGLNRVEGDVEWYRWGGDWVVDVSDGLMANDDWMVSEVNFYSRIHASGEGSPFVLLRCRIDRADIPAFRDYLPVKRMDDKQVDWLNRALAGGEISEGRFYLNGPLDAFPYRNGEGELRLSARVRDGVLDYNEEWPELAGVDGVIEVENTRFEARGTGGSMMSSAIRRVSVRSEDFFRRDRLLEIQGNLRAKTDDVLRFLRRGPLNRTPPPAHSRMSAEGEGDLELDIELPFTRLKEATRVRGAYTFDGGAMELRDGVRLESLSGNVQFTESTVQGENLTGSLFGGPVSADLVTVEPGRPMTFAFDGAGEADMSRLGTVLGPALVSRLQGRARWEGRFVVGPGPNRLTVRSDLAGVGIELPAPLWKPADTAVPLTVDLELGETTRRVELDLGGRLRGDLHYARRDGRPVLERGVLNLGDAAAGERPLPDSELAVAVNGGRIDVDQWLDEIKRLRQRRDRQGDDPDRDRLFDHLRVLEVDVAQFRYLHRDLGAVEMVAATDGDKRWSTRLSGPRVLGVGELDLDDSPPRYRFDLQRLHWPEAGDVPRAGAYKPLPEPSEFAFLSISVDDFRHGQKQLGRLEFVGAPAEHQWRIRQLLLEQPEYRLEASGSWSTDQFGAHRSRLEVTARSEDLGRTLAHLGLPGQVANGRAELDAELGWPGEPGDFTLAKLNGELAFSARKGRFLKLEPGSGRLLGLFNAETLTRRFQLDFRDVFEEGLAFDRINGKAELTAGRLETDGIFVFGPVALLELSGATDLGEETHDLEVIVAPQLGGSLSLAGALANPAAGAMIFVVQKLFKKQMAKLIHYKYRVTGDWDDPQVEAVQPPAPGPGNQVGMPE